MTKDIKYIHVSKIGGRGVRKLPSKTYEGLLEDLSPGALLYACFDEVQQEGLKTVLRRIDSKAEFDSAPWEPGKWVVFFNIPEGVAKEPTY